MSSGYQKGMDLQASCGVIIFTEVRRRMVKKIRCACQDPSPPSAKALSAKGSAGQATWVMRGQRLKIWKSLPWIPYRTLSRLKGRFQEPAAASFLSLPVMESVYGKGNPLQSNRFRGRRAFF